MILPKLPNSRAFTRKEMMDATQNFNQQIGQGSFGKLRQQKKDIAVKVISSFQQFLNEVHHTRSALA